MYIGYGCVKSGAPESMTNSSRQLWPSADWDDWSQTRYTALVFDGIVALLVIAAAFVPALRSWLCPPCSKCGDKQSACQRFVLPVLIGLLCGIWLHFIPCICERSTRNPTVPHLS